MTAAGDRDDAYRAIGRYVAEFSRLVYQMRSTIITYLGRNPTKRAAAELALGEATASPIANAFFAICEGLADLDDDEKAIAQKLRTTVDKEIKRRNDFAHGDWSIDSYLTDPEQMDDPLVRRVKPTRRAGAFETQHLPIEELDDFANGVRKLRQQIREVGALCTGQHVLEASSKRIKGLRVRDIFILREGRVVREGPRAAEGRMPYG